LLRCWACSWCSRPASPPVHLAMLGARTRAALRLAHWTPAGPFHASAAALERAPRHSRTKFMDVVRVVVEGGSGGRGVVSFEREWPRAHPPTPPSPPAPPARPPLPLHTHRIALAAPSPSPPLHPAPLLHRPVPIEEKAHRGARRSGRLRVHRSVAFCEGPHHELLCAQGRKVCEPRPGELGAGAGVRGAACGVRGFGVRCSGCGGAG
jgi:hypothetical protein